MNDTGWVCLFMFLVMSYALCESVKKVIGGTSTETKKAVGASILSWLFGRR